MSTEPVDLARELVAQKRAQSVRWLSPWGLVRTALVVVQGTIFAKYADKRELMASAPRHALDLHETDLVDYVADIGDGFNATYAVACSMAGATKVVAAPAKSRVHTGCPCGDAAAATTAPRLLVLGGDEVYPVASQGNYRLRTSTVYRHASHAASVSDERFVVAVPGNHDWYDGLVSFRRVFCESWLTRPDAGDFLRGPGELGSLDRVGAWHTTQSRSYFSVKLAHGWWLWGIDIQLDAPSDAAQLDYFREAHDELVKADGRLILCTARPSWIDDHADDSGPSMSDRQNLMWFVSRFFDTDEDQESGLRRVRLMLSGDKHHYARYTPPVGADGLCPELVTCGGGGAFLSSTHRLPTQLSPFDFADSRDFAENRISYASEVCYPSRRRSRWGLSSRFATIPFRNQLLWALIGAIYGGLAWTLAIAQGHSGWPRLSRLHTVRWPPWHGLGTPYVVPMSVAVVLLAGLLLGYGVTGARHRRLVGAIAGVLHAVTHVAVLVILAPLVLGALSRGLWPTGTGMSRKAAGLGATTIAVDLAALAALGLLGSCVFACYLLAADFVGMHETDFFSGMRIEGYKSHLRIHVTADELHVRAIGITKVTGDWKDSGDQGRVTMTGFRPTRGFFAVPRAGPLASHEIDAFTVSRDPIEAAVTGLPV